MNAISCSMSVRFTSWAASAAVVLLCLGTAEAVELNVTETYYIDEVRSIVTAVDANLLSLPDTGGFSVGDEVLVIDTYGSGAGTYDFATITEIGGGGLSVDALANTYPAGDRMAVQVVPRYDAVTVFDGGTITARPYDGQTGGIVAFRVAGLLDIQSGGQVIADGLGYVGGISVDVEGDGWQGESYDGTPVQSDQNPNFGAGGAGLYELAGGDITGGGGGGAYGDDPLPTNGHDNYGPEDRGGIGGTPYGIADLSTLFFGSGGGGGGMDSDGGAAGVSGAGGRGGGIVYVEAGGLLLSGTLSAAGQNGADATGGGGNESGGGGGGAGGSLYVNVPNLVSVSRTGPVVGVLGGMGGIPTSTWDMQGGNGGGGRLHFPNGFETFLPEVPAGVLLFDDFDVDWENGWEFVQKGTEGGTINFAVQSTSRDGQPTRALVDTSNSYTYNAPNLDGVYAVVGDASWTDYSYSGTMQSNDDDGIGLLFRFTDDLNHYRLVWAQQDQTDLFGATGGLHLEKVVAGTVTELGSFKASYDRFGHWHDWQVNLQGDRIQVLLDDYPIFDVQDDSLPAGKVGVWGWGSSGIAFDDVQVAENPQFVPAANHDTIRPRETYHEIALADDFSSDGPLLDREGWSVVDVDPSIVGAGVDGESDWQIVFGELTDATNIYPIQGSFGFFGSLALAGDPNWTDYLFTGRMADTDNDGMGVVFRYQDEDNFYRLLISNEFTIDDTGLNEWHQNVPRMRLDLIKDGELVPLANAPFGYAQSTWTDFMVETAADRLAVWIDGHKLFDVVDDRLAAGAIGLIQYGSTDVFYDDILVLLPELTLTWDGLGDGNWGDVDAATGHTRWLDAADNPADHLPDETINVAVNAGTVTVAEDRRVNGLVLGGGTLAVADGVTLRVNSIESTAGATLVLGAGAQLETEGYGQIHTLVAGDGARLDSDDLFINGVLSFSDAAAILGVDGEFELFDDAQYVVQLDGPANNRISSSGDVYLGGTLTLQGVGALDALGDATRTILATTGEGAIDGTFATEPAAGDYLGSGVFHRAVHYRADQTSVDVEVFQAAAGDADGNGAVDNADLQAILGAGSFGTGPGFDWTAGDFNGDTEVNNADLQLILASGFFGAGPYTAVASGGGEGPLGVVPEPGTLLMLAAGALGVLLWRRRKTA